MPRERRRAFSALAGKEPMTEASREDVPAFSQAASPAWEL